MLKNALFFEKTRKIAEALRVLPPNPHWPLTAGGGARYLKVSHLKTRFQAEI